jgi:hypothetical protein
MGRIAKKINSVKDSKLTRSFFLAREQSMPFFFQPKLGLGPTNDVYEREADAVADKVMRMPNNEPTQTANSPLNIQRKGVHGEEDKRQLRRKTRPGIMNGGAFTSVHDTLGSHGNSIDSSTRSFMETRLGYDFGNVRIHTDTIAAKSAQAVNALAYTSGNDIVFNEGQYSPGTEHGKKLLAHELTHVIQQQGKPNQIQRKSWSDDESGCTTTQKILVQLIFDDVGSDKWTAARKTTFRNDFKSSIESTFNGNSYHIKPGVSSYPKSSWGCSAGSTSATCPCHPGGFVPQVEISLVPDGKYSTSEDWEVDVAANSAGADVHSESNTSYGDLDEADNTAIAKRSSGPGITQKTSVHEFGHFLGLDHPGKGLNEGWTVGGVTITKRELSPGATEYSHVGKDRKGRTVDGTVDLMGGGMGLRPFYFDSWKSHLESVYGSDCRWRIR